jgi:hypothetical protein
MKENNIYQALSKAQGMIGSVTKNAVNPFFKSNYADLNQILESVLPVCESLGLTLYQAPKITKLNADVLYTRLSLRDNPEQFVESEIRLFLPTADMQKLGSALSYSRRYSLLSIFNLRTEDDDAQSVSKHPTASQKRSQSIIKAMDKLTEAHKNKDIEAATNVYEWAVDKDYVQVIDKHIQLFGE